MDGTIITSSLPIDASAKGKRRLWLADRARNFQAVEKAFRTKATKDAADILAKGNRRHWPKGIETLGIMFDPLCCRVSSSPMMVWAVLQAMETPFRDSEQVTLTPDERQDGCAMFFVATMPFPWPLTRGLWSFVGTGHMIGRYFQRGGTDLTSALHAAFMVILASPTRSLDEITASDVMVPDDPDNPAGYFWCSAKFHASTMTGKPRLVWRARTWIGRDQCSDAEIATGRRLLTLQPGDSPMAAILMHPMELRRRK